MVFKAAIGVMTAVVIGAAAFIVWWVFLSGPSVVATESGDAVVFKNLLFGEKNLGLSEVKVFEAESGRLLLHGTKDATASVLEFEMTLGVDAAASLVSAGWTVKTESTDATFVPRTGITYRVKCRGNNGWGRMTWTTRKVTLSEQRRAKMPNNRLKLMVTSLACARAAPAAQPKRYPHGPRI